jgi:hypothetical protein
MCEVEMDEDDPIITMVTHLFPDDENEDVEGQSPQPEAPDALQQGRIEASLQIHQSHLTLMQLTAPTCQSSSKTKRTLLFTRTPPQSSFAGITS